MFINFGFEDFGEQDVYTIELKIGNQIQRQRLQGDGQMVAVQFLQLLNQAANSNQPVKVKISKQEEIWNQYRKKNKILENYIQFANKIYMQVFANEFE